MTARSDPRLDPFEKFLLWLSPDRELALKKYGEVMQKTRKYFIRKGCPESEELACETRDRVLRIVNAGDNYPNPDALFCSVADKVRKEYARKPRTEPLPGDDSLPVRPQETEVKERRVYCLQRCLAKLTESERDLITRYYQTRGHSNEVRKLLIAEYGSKNTLRVKAHRIRIKLRCCIDPCMDEMTK